MNRRTEERRIEAVVHGRVLLRRADIGAGGMLIGFHGYAESAEIQMRRLAGIPGAEGWMLVSVQGLNRFYRGRSEDVVAGWMTRQDREVVMADNIAYVNRVVAAVHGADRAARTGRTIVHIGYSQGVAMAFRAAVRGGYASAGVIAVGGDVPPELLADPDSRFPPVLLVRGDRDERYTAARLEQDVAALTARGAAVRTHVFAGGHEWHESVGDVAATFIGDIMERLGRKGTGKDDL